MPNILSKSCLPFTGDLETSILMDLDIDNDYHPNKQPKIDNLNDTQNNFNNDITLDMIDLPDISIVLKDTPANKHQVISVPSSEEDEAEKENKNTNAKPVTENKVQKSKPEVAQIKEAKAVNSTSALASKPDKSQVAPSKKPTAEVESESESESDSGSESDSAIILSSAHSDQELAPKENKNQQNTNAQKGKSVEKPLENKAKGQQQKSSNEVSEKVNAQKDKVAPKPLSEDSDSSDDSSDDSDDEGGLSLAELTSDHSSIPKKSINPQLNETNAKQPAKVSPVKTVADKANIKVGKKPTKDEESESEESSSGSDSASGAEEVSSTQTPKVSNTEISKPDDQKTPQPTKTEAVTPSTASRYNLRSREKTQTPTKSIKTEKEPESESSSGSEETESESESDAKPEVTAQKGQIPAKKIDFVVKGQDQDIKQKSMESKPATVTKQAQKASESESSSGSEETESESESESDSKPNTVQNKPTASKLIPVDSTKKSSDKSISEVKSKDEESSSEEETDSEEETESESESEDAAVQTKSVKAAPTAQPVKINDKQINKPSTGATPQVNKPEEPSSESESDSESESETDSSSEEDESPLKAIAEPKVNSDGTQSTPNQAPKPDTTNGNLTVKQQLASQASKRTFFPKVEAPQITLTQMAQLRNSQIRSRSKDSKLSTVGSLVDLKRLRTDDEESSSEEEASESESDSSDSDDSSSDEDEKVAMPTPKVPKLVKSNKKQKGGKSDLFSLFKDL